MFRRASFTRSCVILTLMAVALLYVAQVSPRSYVTLAQTYVALVYIALVSRLL